MIPEPRLQAAAVHQLGGGRRAGRRFDDVHNVLWQELLKPYAAKEAGLRDDRFVLRREGGMIWKQMKIDVERVWSTDIVVGMSTIIVRCGARSQAKVACWIHRIS